MIWEFGLMTIVRGGWMICCETLSFNDCVMRVWRTYRLCFVFSTSRNHAFGYGKCIRKKNRHPSTKVSVADSRSISLRLNVILENQFAFLILWLDEIKNTIFFYSFHFFSSLFRFSVIEFGQPLFVNSDCIPNLCGVW